MKSWRWFGERLALYLPVVLMGLLAGATYWLVRSTPVAGTSTTAAPVRHEPDYFMRQFSVRSFDAQGRLESEIKGRQAQHYPDTDTLEIDQVQLRSFDAQRRLTTASARTGLSNSDGSEFTLLGQAEVLRAATVDAAGQARPEMRFSGEQLHVFVNKQQLQSDQPVLLSYGQNQFTADRMTFDNRLQQLQLGGRVKGVLLPKVGP